MRGGSPLHHAATFDPTAVEGEQCVEAEGLCANNCGVDEDCAPFGDGLLCVREGNVCDGVCLVGTSG